MTTSTPQNSVVTRLSVMMFLQFFVWGSWFATMGGCLNNYQLGSIIGQAYSSQPIAAIIAPLLLGLIADRFFPPSASSVCSTSSVPLSCS